jgi:hypothetical protein
MVANSNAAVQARVVGRPKRRSIANNSITLNNPAPPRPAAPPTAKRRTRDGAGVQPQAQRWFFQERFAEQARRYPVIVQVHFHGDAGDPRLGGALQLVIAQGEEKQQGGKQITVRKWSAT